MPERLSGNRNLAQTVNVGLRRTPQVNALQNGIDLMIEPSVFEEEGVYS